MKRAHLVVGEAALVIGRVTEAREAAALGIEPREAAAERADPEGARPALQQGADVMVGQRVGAGRVVAEAA